LLLLTIPLLQAATLAAPPAAPQQATVEELAAIQLLRLHTTGNLKGWNALHYAAAAHNVKLVRQLLRLGADPAAADAQYGLTPLHLACMGRVKHAKQLDEVEEARKSLRSLQVLACMVW
jgi:ankyrin repeat protein